MGRLTQRIIAILLGLFFLSYVGYQGYRYYNKPIKTETVYEYSVSRQIPGEGLVIRDETVLDEGEGGMASYLFADATRVSVAETIAEYYRSSTGDQSISRVRELEDEIRLLREAQDTAVANIGGTELYNRDIKDQIGRLSMMVSAGKLEGVPLMRKNLTSLVNKKLISTQKETDYKDRIAQLEEELAGLRRAGAGEIMREVKAPLSGYFSSTVDGYENRLSFDKAEEYTLGDYTGMIEAPPPAGMGGKLGKMVLSPNWYCAVAVPKAQIEWVTNGRHAGLQFAELPEPVPATLIKILEHRDEDTAVLLFRSDLMTEDTINLRRGAVTVHFEQLTGLRIEAADLRFNQTNERGVYILDDQNTVRFRRVEPLYEEESYVLSAMYFAAADGAGFVKLYDQVIVKGVDLYDGKPIQDS